MFSQLAPTTRPAEATLVIARLNARFQPMHRGEVYEDPLQEVLTELGIGGVTGGGTQLGKDNEIEFCEIEIELNDAAADNLDTVKGALESFGAPKGSRLILPATGQEFAFGVSEGLAVYLNGTDLPDQVYQECDVNFVCSEFNRLLGAEGRIQSYWQGPTETALYMYGRSFETMKERLASFLSTYPLCAQARVVQIA